MDARAPLWTIASCRPTCLSLSESSSSGSFHAAAIWDGIQAQARLGGRSRPVNDSWIAACCTARELLLATLNIKDYAEFAEHKVSNSSTEDTQRGMSRGTNHSAQEVTRDTGREQKAQVGRQKAFGDHDVYRPPEAGAQVRILPGAPRLTCSHYYQLPVDLSDLAASWK